MKNNLKKIDMQTEDEKSCYSNWIEKQEHKQCNSCGKFLILSALENSELEFYFSWMLNNLMELIISKN